MIDLPKRPAPEPFFSAGHYLLYEVALFIRNYADKISPDQLHDLGDAIHNLPQALLEYGDRFDERKFRDMYFRPYDDKWAKLAKRTADFSLNRSFDIGIEKRKSLESSAKDVGLQ